jgi:predicted enzyme related to lactoylglutathione lyase
MLLGLRTTIYPTPDLAAGKAFYVKVTGREPYFDESYYVGFRVGGFELGLIPDAEPSADGPQPLWGVEDVAAEIERLVALGAAELDPATDVGGGITVGAVRDPFGNRLGLIKNPYFDPKNVA